MWIISKKYITSCACLSYFSQGEEHRSWSIIVTELHILRHNPAKVHSHTGIKGTFKSYMVWCGVASPFARTK